MSDLLKDMSIRINHCGGVIRQDRLIQGKLTGLQKAIESSYQAAKVKLEDEREFDCLLNPDKIILDGDFKIISIPFEGPCLNNPTKEIQEIGMKIGDIFTWIRNNTEWIVTLQYLEELAYFRGDCYRINCVADLGDRMQKAYVKGPHNLSIAWQNKHLTWNNLNYDAVMIIPKTQENIDYFTRHNRLKIDGKNWEVQGKNMFENGIIEVAIKEYFNNEMEDNQKQIVEEPIEPTEDSYIYGKTLVDPYGQYKYTIVNAELGGQWSVSDSKKALILNPAQDYVNVGILSGKKGTFTLTYTIGDKSTSLDINIQSL